MPFDSFDFFKTLPEWEMYLELVEISGKDLYKTKVLTDTERNALLMMINRLGAMCEMKYNIFKQQHQ